MLLNRRTVLKLSSTAALGQMAAAAPIPTKSATPVVDTTYGKLRGFTHNGVHSFRGISYGGATAGPNRFRPPRKPEPWTGVRDAFQDGHASPQLGSPSRMSWGLTFSALTGEDCLALNVFTPGLSDGRKRPVMVWLHGGGFTMGAGGSLGYDGANLARFGDAVVVTVNHRLNIFGFFYLAGAGEPYQDSGNAGMLDLVAALQWVRDNIARFGGDPGNVTIFGQSGGGGKVCTLMAMPTAKDLFHKAIVQSGSTLKQTPREQAQETTDKILAQLRLKTSQINELLAVPVEKLLAVASSPSLRLGPVVDGHSLPRDPFDPTAPEVSSHVPMIIGSCETEGTLQATPALLSLDEAGLHSHLRERLGAEADQVIELFRKTRPKATPSELYYTIMAFPTSAIIQAERKFALGQAPVYMYQLTWRTPIQDGLRLTPHNLDIPFVLRNHWELPELVGTGPDIEPLADRFSGAWVAFARTGNPSYSGIPKWPPYNMAERATMVINNEWKIVSDLNHDERLIMAKFGRLPMG